MNADASQRCESVSPKQSRCALVAGHVGRHSFARESWANIVRVEQDPSGVLAPHLRPADSDEGTVQTAAARSPAGPLVRVTVPLSLIEQVHGPTDRNLRDHLAELGVYDKDADSCTDPRVAWALMYPSMQAAGLFAEITGAAVTGEDQ